MNSFGKIFRISIFGESHGQGIGLTVDGVPPGIPLTMEDFSTDINRRRSGVPGTTPRKEDDQPALFSGIYNGYTTGAPLTILFNNNDIRSGDYEPFRNTPRPGHADFTAGVKYNGFNDPRGGGTFSGRMTLALVAAGVIAKKILAPVSIDAVILEVGGEKDISMAVKTAAEEGDSVGGLIRCTVKDLPVGWGEPFFDSVESVLSHLVFSIPAVRGIEFGDGFASARMKGSEHNDLIQDTTGRSLTNHSGGINGGITNGNELYFNVAVKPASSISVPQQTINLKTGEKEALEIRGRHDACIALRMPVIIEAVTAIGLADLLLIKNAYASSGGG